MFNNMFENWLVAAVLLALGACIYIRRNSFRTRWEGALTLSIILQVIGFMLIMPLAGGYGRALFYLTGIAHLRDFFADLLFVSSAVAMVQAVAMRLLPPRQINWYMRRVEFPATVASLVMMICIVSTRALGGDTLGRDFVDISAFDGWLRAYWVAYGAAIIWAVGYLARLLLVLRTDPRRKSRAVEILIVACIFGITGTAARVVDVLIDDFTIPTVVIWIGMSVPSVIAGCAAVVSWRSRNNQPPPNRAVSR